MFLQLKIKKKYLRVSLFSGRYTNKYVFNTSSSSILTNKTAGHESIKKRSKDMKIFNLFSCKYYTAASDTEHVKTKCVLYRK